MKTRRRCGAVLAGLLLTMSLAPAALASKAKHAHTLVVTSLPAHASAAEPTFDVLSATPAAVLPPGVAPDCSGLLANGVSHSGPCVVAEPAQPAVFSPDAIGPLSEEATTNPREHVAEPFTASATYSLLLAGIGLIITIARRRM